LYQPKIAVRAMTCHRRTGCLPRPVGHPCDVLIEREAAWQQLID
jgi:hypothetical protein